MDLLALSNSAANFLLYFIMSSQVITHHLNNILDIKVIIFIYIIRGS